MIKPCYGDFEKQSTAPKQPLVSLVMLTFGAKNPIKSSTTQNISVL